MTIQEWLGSDNQLGIDIWNNKYRYNNETFDEWIRRVSGGNEAIADLIREKRFLFGGRILANRGLEHKRKKISLSNCYVISPPEDNIESIFDCAKKLARTYSYGGGCGVDISNLCPNGAKVNNAAEESTGAVSFMDLYSMVTGVISQRGRRGALMLSISCNHPDLEEFIEIKSDLDRITKANISVRITNEFMRAVKNREKYVLSFTRQETGETIEKVVDAYEVFHKLCEMNWNYAEPGILFWDAIESWNLLSCDDSFEYAGTNPCAEEPLPSGGSCLLGSLNLSEFVASDKQFDLNSFRQAVKTSVIALNEVLDEGMPLHPLQEQRDSVRDWRQIGLGILGLSDMLIKMEIRYGSPESIEICNRIGYEMANQALLTSSELAKEYGSYPRYNEDAVMKSMWLTNNANSDVIDKIKDCGIRNSQLLTIAPTGSLSTMLGISGGIEPIYANYYERKTESLHNHDEYYKVYTPIVKQYMDKHNLKDDKDLPNYFVTAQSLDYKERIDMQAVWQRHIDASISSTVNVPNDFSVLQTEELYMRAWWKGLKGVTIFRNGCKRTGVLSTESNSKQNDEVTEIYKTNALPRGTIIKADDNCVGKKRTLHTGCGTLHCEAFFDPDTGELLETYFSKGSQGGCVDADTEYFNGHEWKKISEYRRGTMEKVLQYNENGFAELVEPINYIVNNNVNILRRFTNQTGLDMVLSDEHRMYLYKNYRKYCMGIRSKLTTEIVTVSEYLNRDRSKERHIPTTFSFKATGIPLNDEIIRLLVAVYADGNYDGHKIRISVKKDRKKIRLRELLKSCDIGWSERDIYRTSYTDFYFYPTPSFQEWFVDKHFTGKWYGCTDKQLSIVIDECIHWDGSTGEGSRLGAYYTSKKEEADFIQFALARLGYRATISLNNGAKTIKDSYRVRWSKQNVHNIMSADVEDYNTKDGHSYCFTVPSGLLVLRRNNKIFITGNCNNFMIGLSRMISLAARGGIGIYEIIDQLKSSGTCPSYAVRTATKHDTSKGSCCPVAIGNALIDMYNEIQNDIYDDLDENEEALNNKSINCPCPQCGEELYFEGGCNICKACGYTKCD